MTTHLFVYACLTIGLFTALVGGVFQAFSDFVMAGLIRAAPAGGIDSMQQINRTVFRSAFLAITLALAPIMLAASLYAWQSLEGSTNSGGIKGIYILKTALCVLFIMLLIQGLSVALRAGLKLRGSRQADMFRHTKIAFIPSSKADGNS